MNRHKTLELLVTKISDLYNISLSMQAVALSDIDAPEIDECLQDIVEQSEDIERFTENVYEEW